MPGPGNAVQLSLSFERWRPVRAWGDLYEVSNLGNVRSLDRTRMVEGSRGVVSLRRYRGRILKQWRSSGGYPQVGLHRDAVKVTRDVHPLVAEAFHGPCPEGMEVAHLDGDRANNRADNLAFKTHAENEADKVRHGTLQCGERQGSSKLKEPEIVAIRERHAAGETQESLGRAFGVSQGHVSDIVHRKCWAHLR
jgi:hypothetical protein